MLRLWVKDNMNGAVHEYGTSRHDSLVLQKDGSLHYENLQCCTGTKYSEEGYSFCREDGTIPDATAVDVGDEYLDIGGSYFKKQAEEKGCEICNKPAKWFGVFGTSYPYLRVSRAFWESGQIKSVACPFCGRTLEETKEG